jgi:hypothetical protein
MRKSIFPQRTHDWDTVPLPFPLTRISHRQAQIRCKHHCNPFYSTHIHDSFRPIYLARLSKTGSLLTVCGKSNNITCMQQPPPHTKVAIRNSINFVSHHLKMIKIRKIYLVKTPSCVFSNETLSIIKCAVAWTFSLALSLICFLLHLPHEMMIRTTASSSSIITAHTHTHKVFKSILSRLFSCSRGNFSRRPKRQLL